MTFQVIKNHKDQLLALINTANNIQPPIKAKEVSFSVPQDGSWSEGGKSYNSLVEMTFLPGYRSDPTVDVPFFYNRTPATAIVDLSEKNPIFRDKGPGPFTSHSIIPYINELYGLTLTTDDIVLTNGIPVSTESYAGGEAHTSVLLDFTPSLRFNGSMTVFFGSELKLSLSSLYVGPQDMELFNEAWTVSGWNWLTEVTLPGDGFPTLTVGSSVEAFLATGLLYAVNCTNARFIKSDKSKLLIDLTSSVNGESGWWIIPKTVRVNGEVFNFQASTPFAVKDGSEVTTATYVAANGLPLDVVAGSSVYLHYGDDLLKSDPTAI